MFPARSVLEAMDTLAGSLERREAGCADSSGNHAAASVIVTVPHDRR